MNILPFKCAQEIKCFFICKKWCFKSFNLIGKKKKNTFTLYVKKNNKKTLKYHCLSLTILIFVNAQVLNFHDVLFLLRSCWISSYIWCSEYMLGDSSVLEPGLTLAKYLSSLAFQSDFSTPLIGVYLWSWSFVLFIKPSNSGIVWPYSYSWLIL